MGIPFTGGFLPSYYPVGAPITMKMTSTLPKPIVQPPEIKTIKPTPIVTDDKKVSNSFQPSQRGYDYNAQSTPPSPTRYHNPPSKLKKMGLMKDPVLTKPVPPPKPPVISTPEKVKPKPVPQKNTTSAKAPKKYQHSAAWLNKKEQERAAAAAREAELKLKKKPLKKGTTPEKKPTEKKVEKTIVKSEKMSKEVRKDKKTKLIKHPEIGNKGTPSVPQKLPTKKRKMIEQKKREEELKKEVVSPEVVATQPPEDEKPIEISKAEAVVAEVTAELDHVFGPVQMVPLQLIDTSTLDVNCEDFFSDFSDITESGTRKRSISDTELLHEDPDFIEHAFKRARYSEEFEDEYDSYPYQELMGEQSSQVEEEEGANTSTEEGSDIEYHFQVHLVHNSEGNDHRRIHASGAMSWHDLINSAMESFQCDHFGGLGGLVVGVDSSSKYSLGLPSGEELYHPLHVPSEEHQKEKPCMAADKVSLFSSSLGRDDIMTVVFASSEEKPLCTITLHVENVVRSDYEDEGITEQGEDNIHGYFNDYEEPSEVDTDEYLANGLMIESA